MPFVFVVLYAIPAYNLRTSRQTRLLDIESKVPLYSLFAEMSSGVEHIRAFGWESSFVDESIEALDYSQKPFYYRAALQSWLELAMDLSIMVLAVTLVIVATVFKDTTSQAALGLSLLNLITFSNMLNFAVAAWTLLETALGAVARLRTFLSKTPNEEQQGEVSLPSHWPHTGTIVFSNVTAKYK
jgi:ABC-type multidrug transport system fused ATPase/permease subunit